MSLVRPSACSCRRPDTENSSPNGTCSAASELEEATRQLESLRQQTEEYQREVQALKAEVRGYEKPLAAVVRDHFPELEEEKALALITEAEQCGLDFADVVRVVETTRK